VCNVHQTYNAIKHGAYCILHQKYFITVDFSEDQDTLIKQSLTSIGSPNKTSIIWFLNSKA